ncbi:hypothetical protein GQ42DRAFT_38459 [Ramicandelaber brevisporus]|nr:hypothetical protein GQ42DRAFT_38459 [Ramicandelaber brevisporus]
MLPPSANVESKSRKAVRSNSDVVAQTSSTSDTSQWECGQPAWCIATNKGQTDWANRWCRRSVSIAQKAEQSRAKLSSAESEREEKRTAQNLTEQRKTAQQKARGQPANFTHSEHCRRLFSPETPLSTLSCRMSPAALQSYPAAKRCIRIKPLPPPHRVVYRDGPLHPLRRRCEGHSSLLSSFFSTPASTTSLSLLARIHPVVFRPTSTSTSRPHLHPSIHPPAGHLVSQPHSLTASQSYSLTTSQSHSLAAPPPRLLDNACVSPPCLLRPPPWLPRPSSLRRPTRLAQPLETTHSSARSRSSRSPTRGLPCLPTAQCPAPRARPRSPRSCRRPRTPASPSRSSTRSKSSPARPSTSRTSSARSSAT